MSNWYGNYVTIFGRPDAVADFMAHVASESYKFDFRKIKPVAPDGDLKASWGTVGFECKEFDGTPLVSAYNDPKMTVSPSGELVKYSFYTRSAPASGIYMALVERYADAPLQIVWTFWDNTGPTGFFRPDGNHVWWSGECSDSMPFIPEADMQLMDTLQRQLDTLKRQHGVISPPDWED